MRDIKLTWDSKSMGAAWSFSGNDVETSQNLLTPVLVSLFTDARASDDDTLLSEADDDRRGWWGDSTNASLRSDSVGSRLWLLDREKNISSAVVRAKTYIMEALRWMVDEGVASSVEVSVEAQQVSSATVALAYQILIRKPMGTSETYKFQQEWKAVQNGS